MKLELSFAPEFVPLDYVASISAVGIDHVQTHL
jgi:hypothetical protein